MTFTRRQLKRFAVECPENLVLVDNVGLMELYRGEKCDEQLQANCLAELYVRWFVGDSERLCQEECFLNDVTPNGIPRTLSRLRMTQDMLREEELRAFFESPLWTGSDAAEDYIERLVRERLHRLMMQTDGFVPVYNVREDGAGLFIPFELVSRSGRAPSAVDTAGKTITKWNVPVRGVLGDAWQLRVCYRQGREVPALSGRSLLLPLLVARWKKEGRVPAFNPWQLLFTGDIDADGRAVPVKTEEKKAGVRAVFQRGVNLVAPSDAPYSAETRETRGIDPIPSGWSGERLLDAVRSCIEQVRGCRLSQDYVRDRLPTFEREIRQETVGAWDRQIARVDAMLKIMGKFGAPERHLQLLMLKSAAYCHSGRTAEALRENARALAFAREKGMAYAALRLEVEQLVEYQDSQRFDEISLLAKPLLARIGKASLRDAARQDLLMRYYGTMAQVDMEAGLHEQGTDKPARAKKNLERALDCARALDRPGDILQDLNYLYLWYALFDPTSDDLSELGREIESRVKDLASEGERIKNRAYFLRERMVACFMCWRREGDLASPWRTVQDVPGGSAPWMVASFMRMKGALAAAANDAETAQACFAAGEGALPLADWWKAEGDVLSSGPVFAQIRLALLTQAYCSLVGLGRNGEADAYRRKALEFLKECPAVLRRIGAAECKRALSAKRPPKARSLPLFYY